jgi:hypothetical protein
MEWPNSNLERFNILAGVAAILDLLFTLWVLYRVSRIEKRYKRQGLVPYFHGKLVAFVRNLGTHAQSKNFDGIRESLVGCRTILLNAIPYLPKQRKKGTTQATLMIDAILLESDSALWNQSGVIKAELKGQIETLDNLMYEMNWSGRDG